MDAITPAAVIPGLQSARTAATRRATLLLDAGVAVELVQDLLGHRSPDTTQRYDRGTRRLDGHAAYRLASIRGGGS
jgi:integrase